MVVVAVVVVVVAVVVIVVVVVLLVRLLLLPLFPTKVCWRCEPVSLTLSGFELVLTGPISR